MHRPPRSSGSLAACALALSLLGTLLWGAMAAGAVGLSSGLLGTRARLDEAERALRFGSLRSASIETLAANRAAKGAARGRLLARPLLDLARLVPGGAAVVDALPRLVKAGEAATAAAGDSLAMARGSIAGPDAVVVPDRGRGSRIRLDRLADMAADVTRARQNLARARRELTAIDRTSLPDRLARAVTGGIERAIRTDDRLADAQEGLGLLPRILGGDGTRNYLLAMQNSAELRGTGGSILRFALLGFSDGRGELLDTKTVYDVDIGRRPLSIPLPEDAWYVRGIRDARRFGNANWSPDWPLSSRLTVAYGRAGRGKLPPIHGVIGVDPHALTQMLPGVPRVKTGTGRPITKENAEAFLLYKSYAQFPDPFVRRKQLNDVVQSFYEALLRPDRPTELLRGIGSSLAQKHIQIWLADPDEQRYLERMNWDGGIETSDGDYLAVVEQNVGGNKLDYVALHEQLLDVTIDGRAAEIAAELRVHNRVTLPRPRYWLGDSNGLHRPMLNVYVPRDAVLERARTRGRRLDGAAEGLAAWVDGRPPAHRELGRKVWSAVLEIPPLSSAALLLDYRVPGAVRAEEGRMVYRLRVQHQPKPHPESLRIRLRLPPEARSVEAPGWEREGSVLSWEGKVDRDMSLEVSWR